MDKKTIAKWKEAMPEIARHTSERERTAVDAERETDDLKKQSLCRIKSVKNMLV